jgi:hypothetical protein
LSRQASISPGGILPFRTAPDHDCIEPTAADRKRRSAAVLCRATRSLSWNQAARGPDEPVGPTARPEPGLPPVASATGSMQRRGTRREDRQAQREAGYGASPGGDRFDGGSVRMRFTLWYASRTPNLAWSRRIGGSDDLLHQPDHPPAAPPPINARPMVTRPITRCSQWLRHALAIR